MDRVIAVAALGLAGCLCCVASAAADSGPGARVTVRSQGVSEELRAYGQIEPMALVRVRSGEPGTLSGLRVVPGSAVQAGEILARIGGPRMRSLRVAREQALRGAAARERSAERALRIARRQFQAQLATVQEVDAARAEWAAARAASRTAAARLRELRALGSVRAPSTGTVIAVQAADGEQLAAGQPLLSLQPAGRLWIRAEYYGADASALHVGMQGRFRPAGGGEALQVRVSAVSAAMEPDGGLRVGLLPAHSGAVPPWWINGQWGRLALRGPEKSMVLVPTQALILDRGRWWVLVHAPSGDEPRAVVPGPAVGWDTAIDSGLKPGQQVVATDAFLEYHRGIARSYTPPD